MAISYAALAYCLWNARDITEAWNMGSMYERYGGWLLFIWLLPFLYWIGRNLRDRKSYACIPNQLFLVVAVGISFLGNIGELHVLNNVSLALAVAAFIPFSWAWLVWLFTGAAWVPQVSWMLSHLVPNYTSWYFSFRMMLILAGSLLLLWELKSVRSYD
jgi:hypothetical protein